MSDLGPLTDEGPWSDQGWQADNANTLLGLADLSVPEVARTWRAQVEQLLDTGALGEALTQLDAGNWTWADSRVLDALFDLVADGRQLSRVLANLSRRGFAQTAQAVATAAPQLSGSLESILAKPYPEAATWAYEEAGKLIVEITSTTRQVVSMLVTRSQLEGWPPPRLAAEIRRHVGLHSRYSNAVLTYQRGLVAQGLPGGRIAELVTGYAERLKDARAMLIARTETLAAANHGQQMLWQQAYREGFLDPRYVRRKWVVTRDDKLCERCAQMATEERTYAGLFEPFAGVNKVAGQWIEQPVMTPPLHPGCRCAMVLEVLSPAEIVAYFQKHLSGRHNQKDHGRRLGRTARGHDPQEALDAEAEYFMWEGARKEKMLNPPWKDVQESWADYGGALRKTADWIMGRQSTWDTEKPEAHQVSKTMAMLRKVRDASSYKRPLYRGLWISKDSPSYGKVMSWLTKPSKTVDFPLIGTSRDETEALRFANGGAMLRTGKSAQVLLEIEPGAKAVTVEGDQFAHEQEMVTGGRFEVLGVEQTQDLWVVRLRQTHVSDPDKRLAKAVGLLGPGEMDPWLLDLFEGEVAKGYVKGYTRRDGTRVQGYRRADRGPRNGVITEPGGQQAWVWEDVPGYTVSEVREHRRTKSAQAAVRAFFKDNPEVLTDETADEPRIDGWDHIEVDHEFMDEVTRHVMLDTGWDESGIPDDFWEDQYGEGMAWSYFLPARQIRRAAKKLLGVEENTADPHLEHDVANFGTGTKIPEGDADRAAFAMLDSLNSATAHNDYDMGDALYRGVAINNEIGYRLDDIRGGDTFDLPLASFTDYRPTAERFGEGVVFKLQGPAKSIRGMQMDSPFYRDAEDLFNAPYFEDDYGEIRKPKVGDPVDEAVDPDFFYAWSDEDLGPHEWVTGGRFRVVSNRRSKTGGRIITIEQVGTFDPADGMLMEVAKAEGLTYQPWDLDALFDPFPRRLTLSRSKLGKGLVEVSPYTRRDGTKVRGYKQYRPDAGGKALNLEHLAETNGRLRDKLKTAAKRTARIGEEWHARRSPWAPPVLEERAAIKTGIETQNANDLLRDPEGQQMVKEYLDELVPANGSEIASDLTVKRGNNDYVTRRTRNRFDWLDDLTDMINNYNALHRRVEDQRRLDREGKLPYPDAFRALEKRYEQHTQWMLEMEKIGLVQWVDPVRNFEIPTGAFSRERMPTLIDNVPKLSLFPGDEVVAAHGMVRSIVDGWAQSSSAGVPAWVTQVAAHQVAVGETADPTTDEEWENLYTDAKVPLEYLKDTAEYGRRQLLDAAMRGTPAQPEFEATTIDYGVKDSLRFKRKVMGFMYRRTQAELASMGFGPDDHVLVVRGYGEDQLPSNIKPVDVLSDKGSGWNQRVHTSLSTYVANLAEHQPLEADMAMNPASSWTVDPIITTGFGDADAVAAIPRWGILSTYATGLGAQIELELVVADEGVTEGTNWLVGMRDEQPSPEDQARMAEVAAHNKTIQEASKHLIDAGLWNDPEAMAEAGFVWSTDIGGGYWKWVGKP